MIDTHIHFWHFNPVRDSWMDGSMGRIRRDFLPADLEPIFAVHKLMGCVAVQASQSNTETQFLLELASKNPMIRGVVGWIDLKDPAIDEKLSTFSGLHILKGFRHIAMAEPDHFLLQDDIIRGIKALGAHNYTFDILLHSHQLQAAVDLVARLPGQRFVINHCGKPNIKSNKLQQWKRDIQTLARHQHVYCKLSGLMTETARNNWNEQEIHTCLDVVFECFGTARVMYGSDWPVMLLAGNYSQWFELMLNYTAKFSLAERQRIFSSNAVDFYQI